jgi:ABC-type antimicrobial peptide transport system permease subunit
LAIVSAVILTLIVLQMVGSQQKEIALFRLMGARKIALFRFVFLKAAALVSVGATVAWGASHVAFPRFPRRVIVGTEDYILLVVAAFLLAAFASALAYRSALRVEASTLLAT